MLFEGRADAGAKLSLKLAPYRGCKDVVVIGLARGGVVVAAAAAKLLEVELDVIVIRKVGAPENEELAIGAVAETGESFFNKEIMQTLGVSPEYIRQETLLQKEVAAKRARLYRGKKGASSYQGKTVILVDDGIATGATMHAAISSAKKRGATTVVVAVPVAPPEAAREFSSIADKVICLYAPETFYAVGQFYRDFDQVGDDEIIALLR